MCELKLLKISTDDTLYSKQVLWSLPSVVKEIGKAKHFNLNLERRDLNEMIFFRNPLKNGNARKRKKS